MKPAILLVDDDPQVLRAIRLDMRRQYAQDYELLDAPGPTEARQILDEISAERGEVALVLSDQRMPDGDGVGLLEHVREQFPDARRALLTAYADTEAAIRAINTAKVHYYLTKPWEPAQERLYPVLDELLEDYKALARMSQTGTRLIGYQWSPKSHDLKDFLSGNLVPYRFLPAEQAEGRRALEEAGLTEADLPVLLQDGEEPMRNPSPRQVGEALGLSQGECEVPYDVAIVGAGPAGLAAAVYGASEGLKTLLIDRRAPGGQAGTSSRIENYLGFPQGISGEELSRRAITQAKRLGADFMTPLTIQEIRQEGGYKVLLTGDGRELRARALIIATGVDYRRLEARNIENYTGAGVYYGAANTEAQACRGGDVYIVGGGNSAGQSAMYLSRFASHVYVLVRSPEGLAPSMSQYLIDQIEATENITVRPCCVVEAVGGNERLETLCIRNLDTGGLEENVPAAALFIFIGTRPVTDWIGMNVLKDPKGFLITGRDVLDVPGAWSLEREPYLLETCAPGVFAAGDVRSGAMNRVASAVGEGAMAVKFIHQYLNS